MPQAPVNAKFEHAKFEPTQLGGRTAMFAGLVATASFLPAFTQTFDPDVPWHL